MNVFGSKIGLHISMDLKLGNFYASIFGYRFRVAPHPEKRPQFRLMTSGFGFPHVMEGNKRGNKAENSRSIRVLNCTGHKTRIRHSRYLSAG